MLKLVPFNNAWVGHDKLDIKAIYRRPRWIKDAFDQETREIGPDGLPLWDLTGPLPLKNHNKWAGKGFEYVTLADRDSLLQAAKAGTVEGSVRDYDQHQTGGPWNYKMYAAGQSVADNQALLQLRESVQRYGSEAYQNIRREVDPTFTLPASLQGIEAGGDLPPLVDAAPAAPKVDPRTGAGQTAGTPARARRRGTLGPKTLTKKDEAAA